MDWIDETMLTKRSQRELHVGSWTATIMLAGIATMILAGGEACQAV